MNANVVADARERQRALDPAASFIVQAPAGAGKTELLIQRYLRLLATVRRPEEILAITFTRKAAGEMKRRVLEALHEATRPLPADAGDHTRCTHALAQAALARDAEFRWRLLENTVRLHIKTIDSFNASLTRQMPVLAHLGWQPGLVDDARDLYHEAAVRTLALLDQDAGVAPAIERLLTHLDGDQGKAAELVAGMLARRDQWLRPDFQREPSRDELEAALRTERERVMARARDLFPEAEGAALCEVASHAASRLASDAAAGRALAAQGLRVLGCAAMKGLPAADEAAMGVWIGIATLLLTNDGTWRRRFDRNLGFPAKKDGGDETIKEAAASLAQRLGTVTGLREALEDLFILPPGNFTDGQWEALSAVVSVLPLAAAQLLVVFAERGEVDHAQIAEGAVRSLGEEGAPTDLMLTLDERLSHILVDEFQDTSHSQWRLLQALTAEWMPGDGRTVFAVGDPMQSIYRFREADVGLYLRAWNGGLQTVRLERLRLSTNFRSQQGIVDWVNRVFREILPKRDDASEGAVALAASSAFHGPLQGEAVTWHAFIDEDRERARANEAARVAELVAAARMDDPEGKVAILVRNRTHLDRIVPALRAAGLRFRAVDIEPLGDRQGVRDLVALTRALAHAADRVAWLAVLRAPWCGLPLADLHALVDGDDRAVPELMAAGPRLAAMAPASRARLDRVAAILLRALEERLRGTLRERVEDAWLALGGPACLASVEELEDAETYFDRLDEIAEADDLADPARLEEHLADLFGAPDLGAPDSLQVMTIHKAKGLQFSTVIVPGLDRLPRAADSPLFLWKLRPEGSLLMAPIKEVSEEKDAAYEYLKELDAREEAHEIERLFYVAATRAVRRLHLLGRVGYDPDARDGPALRAPAARSLLGKAWTDARAHFEAVPRTVAAPEPATAPHARATADDLRWIRPEALAVRVEPAAVVPVPEPRESRSPIEFSWVGETARHVGTVAHRWLQRIAEEGLASWSAGRVRSLRSRVGSELERRGVPEAERAGAAERVLSTLEAALADERGRWILGDHEGAANEVRMCVVEGGRVRLVVMDRVFTEQGGKRWIVDYKTSHHEGADPGAFLDSERERYADPMRRYARALGGEARLGLYFPLIPGWREIDT